LKALHADTADVNISVCKNAENTRFQSLF